MKVLIVIAVTMFGFSLFLLSGLLFFDAPFRIVQGIIMTGGAGIYCVIEMRREWKAMRDHKQRIMEIRNGYPYDGLESH